MVENVDEFLAHYGKKGMKWGVSNPYFTTGGKKDTSHIKKALDLPGHRRNPTKSQKRQDRIDILDAGALGTPGKVASAALKLKHFTKAQAQKKVDNMVKNKKKIIATTAVLGGVSAALIAAGTPKGQAFLGKSWDKLSDLYTTWDANRGEGANVNLWK